MECGITHRSIVSLPMKKDKNVREFRTVDPATHHGAEADLRAEIAYLKKKLSDLQQLIGGLLVENERMRQSHRRPTD
jgi:hypothetical protein